MKCLKNHFLHCYLGFKLSLNFNSSFPSIPILNTTVASSSSSTKFSMVHSWAIVYISTYERLQAWIRGNLCKRKYIFNNINCEERNSGSSGSKTKTMCVWHSQTISDAAKGQVRPGNNNVGRVNCYVLVRVLAMKGQNAGSCSYLALSEVIF